ncbi:hypothetical protein D3C87_1311120 [compost metagenome]
MRAKACPDDGPCIVLAWLLNLAKLLTAKIADAAKLMVVPPASKLSTLNNDPLATLILTPFVLRDNMVV